MKLAYIDFVAATRDYRNSPCEAIQNFENECLAAYKAACEVYEAVFDEEWILTDDDRTILELSYKDIFGGETK